MKNLDAYESKIGEPNINIGVSKFDWEIVMLLPNI